MGLRRAELALGELALGFLAPGEKDLQHGTGQFFVWAPNRIETADLGVQISVLSRESVVGLTVARARRMTLAEARGYIRARRSGNDHSPGRVAVPAHAELSAAEREQVVSLALDQVVQLVMRTWSTPRRPPAARPIRKCRPAPPPEQRRPVAKCLPPKRDGNQVCSQHHPRPSLLPRKWSCRPAFGAPLGGRRLEILSKMLQPFPRPWHF